MKSTVKQRIRTLLEEYSENVNSISLKIGIPQKTLNRQINEGAEVSLKTTLAICDYFEDVSPEWLLTGEGEMIKQGNIGSFVSVGNNKGNVTTNVGSGAGKGQKITNNANMVKEPEASYGPPNLKAENEALKAENENLKEKIGNLQALIEEKERLIQVLMSMNK